jgi:hypothetical protein
VSRCNPCLVVHIGQHKTGSKALQSFLAHNRIALRARGVLYPVGDYPCSGIRAYAISQFRLYALIRREAIGECFGEDAAASYWRQQGRYCTPFDSAHSFFEAFDAEVRRSGLGQVVVSSEDLFDMHTAHELAFSPELIEVGTRRLAALASDFGYDARVVVYLRRQDHLLGAHYVQFIKGSPDHHIDFEEFARAFAPRLDTRLILARWADVFGPDRVRVRRYEQTALPGGIVPDFFGNVLGLPVPATCVQPPADAESVNQTLHRDFVEFIRILNRRGSAGQSVFARTAVLEASLRAETPARGSAGISAWLSPAARRHLLHAYQEGNAAIARDFLRRTDGRLFAEPWPEDADGWEPYLGFSPERATAIALAVHETILARRLLVDHSEAESGRTAESTSTGAVTAVKPFTAGKWSAPAKLVRKLRESVALLGQRRAGPSLCLGWASPPRGRSTLGFGYFSGVFLDPVLGFPG